MASKAKVPSGSKVVTKRLRNTATEIDVPDLIEVICGVRKEAFPFERNLALLLFSSWLRWPNRPEVLNQAKIVGAAFIIRAIKNGSLKIGADRSRKAIESLFASVVTPDSLCEFMIDVPFSGGFREDFAIELTGASDASTIIEFLVRCPTELKPSLNKAMFFIEKAKVIWREEGTGADTKRVGISLSSLKKSWSEFSAPAPFVFVAEASEYLEIVNLAPDDEAAIKHTQGLLRHPQDLKLYFGAVRHVQNIMQGILENRGGTKFLMVPESIKPELVEFDAMDEEDLAIVRKYKAPTIKYHPD